MVDVIVNGFFGRGNIEKERNGKFFDLFYRCFSLDFGWMLFKLEGIILYICR